MLDHQQRVAFVAQIVHQANKLANIARVKPDARFVHHEERVHQRCAQAGRQIHALDFAPAQRARRAMQCEITDADFVKIVQARADFITQHLGCLVRN